MINFSGIRITDDQLHLVIGVVACIFVLFSLISLILIWKKISEKKDRLPPAKKTGQKTPATYVPEEKKWFDRLHVGLRKTHQKIIAEIDQFFLSKAEKTSRAEIYVHLFEILVQADVGVTTSEFLVEKVKNRLMQSSLNLSGVELAAQLKSILQEEILAIFADVSALESHPDRAMHANDKPHVVLMVGVNGVGKTTTTGKLAFKAHHQGQKVHIGAADTFRAAAIEQLAIWATRSHAELIRLQEGADPASVAYETVKKGAEAGVDLCLIDTAGRLQNRQDLMQELAKICRVIAKTDPTAPHEVLLVLDATTGQNALQQARLFKEIVKVTGLILTKLDGTAKGGVAIAIAYDLKLPIRYVGVGESVEDLEVFNASEFVRALFSN